MSKGYPTTNSESYKLVQRVIMLSALGILSFLVIFTSIRFFSQANNISIAISSVKPDEMVYPPMKLCYSHWAAWVNLSAASEMNFTKPEVYYAMSYLTQHIYSVEKFDIKKTEESFFEKLQDQNLTMTQFFLKIARPFDYMIFGREFPINHTTTIEPLEIHVSLYNKYYTLCYTFSEAAVAEIALSRRKHKENSADKFYKSKVEEYKVIINPSVFEPIEGLNEINDTEQEYYLKYLSGIMTNGPPNSYRKIFPALVYVNAYDPNPIVATILTPVSANIKASVHVWKDNLANPCVKDKPYIVNDRACYDKCENKIDMDQYYCNTSKYGYPPDGAYFYFIEDNGRFSKPERYPRCFPEAIEPYDYYVRGDMQCMNQCKQKIGCVVWTYDINIQQKPFNGPVSIYYPILEHTLIHEVTK